MDFKFFVLSNRYRVKIIENSFLKVKIKMKIEVELLLKFWIWKGFW